MMAALLGVLLSLMLIQPIAPVNASTLEQEFLQGIYGGLAPIEVEDRLPLVDYVRQAWPIVETDPYVHADYIDAICTHLEAVTDGKIRNLLVNIGPRHSKPVYEEEPVLTRRGRIRLRDVVVGDEILSHRGRYCPVLEVHEQGSLPTIRIRTRQRRTIRAAGDHPFLTPVGWVQASDLQVGDCLAVVATDQELTTDEVSVSEARLLGYLVGDGHIAEGVSYTSADRFCLDDFQHCAEAVGFACRPRSRNPAYRTKAVSLVAKKRESYYPVGTVGPVRRWLQQHGLDRKNSYEKRIPPAVLASSNAVIEAFLSAYWSCDGMIRVKHRGPRKITWIASATTVNRGLAEDVQHAALRLGIHLRIRKNIQKIKTQRQGDEYVSYQAVTTERGQVAKFADWRWLLPRKREQAEKVRKSYFPQLHTPDQITELSNGGELPCRCLTVGGDQSFTVQDIAVHNSTIVCVFWPSWEWGPAGLSHMRYLFSSHADNVVTRDSVRCRDLIKSQWYQDQWGERFKLSYDQNQKRWFRNTSNGFRMSVTLGAKYTGLGGSRLICDDPHDVKDRRSKTKIEHNVDAYKSDFSKRVNDPVKTPRVVIAQRVSENDLSSHLIKEGYTHLCLPSKFESEFKCRVFLDSQDKKTDKPFWEDSRTEPGQLLNPKRYPPQVIEEEERDAQVFSALHQQRPTPLGGDEVKQEWFRYWVPEGMKLPPVLVRTKDGVVEIEPEIIPGGLRKTQSWDMAFKKTDDSSHVVGQVWGWHPKISGSYLMDQFRERISFVDTLTAFKQMTAKHPDAGGKLVEDKANGPAVISSLKRKITGIIAVNPGRDSKLSRASACVPLIEAGNVYLPHPILKPKITSSFINEWCSLPNPATWDCIDSGGQFLNKYRIGKKRRLVW